MHKQLRKIIQSLIGLSVLAMFVIAIVAGQARANLQPAQLLEADIVYSADAGSALKLGQVQRIDALPIIVEAVLLVPLHIIRDAK